MRKRVYISVVVVALIGLFAASTAKAQISRPLIANIPFDFQVGKATLPAGEYVVSRVFPYSGQAVLRLRSEDGRAVAVVNMITMRSKAPDRAKLIFHRYGSEYFFAEAWSGGESTGLLAPKSRAERATQRELAGLKPQMQEVVLNIVEK